MSNKPDYLEGARRRLEEQALQFARVTKLGHYLENGSRVSFCGTDQQMYIETFRRELERAAFDLLSEMTSMPLPERSK